MTMSSIFYVHRYKNFKNQGINPANVTDTINMHAACLICQGQTLKVVAIGWLFPARNVTQIRLS